MMAEIWQKIAEYTRSRLIGKMDPTYLFAEQSGVRPESQINHKGFYVGIVDSKENDLIREGFLKDNQTNVLDSIDIIVKNIYNQLKAKGITKPTIETSKFYYSLITECLYIKNPLQWDENSDGVCFQWGQKYKGLYLPYQIKKMPYTKIEIMHRLCSFECGVVSNLWQLETGLVFRLICNSYAS
jgi:hypothetical protein